MLVWLAGLVLKPYIGIAVIAILWFGSHFIAAVIYRITPDCALKRYLFLGWNGSTPSGRAALVKQ